MYIPKPIYEGLPYAYVLLGIISIVHLHNAVGVLGGGTFILTGALVFKMRSDHRKAMARAEVALEKKKKEREKKRLIRLEWRPDFECGNKLIDIQHQELFELSNDLLDAAIVGKAGEVKRLLEKLKSDIAAHFKSEEELFELFKCSFVHAHKKAHAALLQKTDEIIEGYQNGLVGIPQVFTFVSHELIAMHIAKEDKLFTAASSNTRSPQVKSSSEMEVEFIENI